MAIYEHFWKRRPQRKNAPLSQKLRAQKRFIVRSAAFFCRRATQQFRAMPHFMIVGAQKSGTTSLFYYLSQHPQILTSFRKEVHYFDGGLNPDVDTFDEPIGWYRAHFPLRANLKKARIAGEASPSYMFHPLAPKRIHDVLPQVKLIAILRNPTERAISHYNHVVRRRGLQLSILAALRGEDEQIAVATRAQDYKSDSFLLRSFKSRGLYKQQLERCLQYFPRRQLLILSSERFFDEPADTLKVVFKFLGVDVDYQIRDLTPRNYVKRKAQAPEEVYEYLDNFFKPHNEALYEFIGEDFGW